MSDRIVQLHKAYPAQDVVQGLRNIADEIEASGEPVATCVVCIGSTSDRPHDDTLRLVNTNWSTFALGTRADVFSVRGLLFTCASFLDGADQ